MSEHSAALISEHAQRFQRIEGDVSELKEQMATTTATVDRIDGDLYNHGQDGLKTQFIRFMAESKTREEERDRAQRAEHEEVRDALVSHDRKLMRRLTVFGIILALLTLLVEARHEIVTGVVDITVSGYIVCGTLTALLRSCTRPAAPSEHQ